MRCRPPFSAFQAAPPDYELVMLSTRCSSLHRSRRRRARSRPRARASAAWNPAADYITAGQDEPGYRSWYLAAPAREPGESFNAYLATYQVAGILPTWQLLRTATAWEKCGGQPFEIPPTAEWPHIVQTLRYIHDYVIPAIGPVEAVSAYRNPLLNQCAGGAPESAHKHFSAIDLVPLKPTDARGPDERPLHDALPARPRLPGRPGLLCLSPLPRRHDQIPALEHGPGGCGAMPADRPSRG